jgi:hypothetical protein
VFLSLGWPTWCQHLKAVPKTLSWRIEPYTLFLMSLRFHTFRAAVATGLSLWLAVLACLVGCTVPIFASSGSINAASIQEKAGDQSQSALMANMGNCPHHSNGNAPAKPNDPKPIPGGRMACCPVEVTVASKPDTAAQRIEPASDFVLESGFSLVTTRFFHSVEIVPPSWHSGRDTLLETHLLRV